MPFLDTFALSRTLDTTWPAQLFAKSSPRLRRLPGHGAGRALLCREEAATSVEYAIVLAMVLMATFSAIQMVGGQAGFLWDGIIDDLKKVGFFH